MEISYIISLSPSLFFFLVIFWMLVLSISTKSFSFFKNYTFCNLIFNYGVHYLIFLGSSNYFFLSDLIVQKLLQMWCSFSWPGNFLSLLPLSENWQITSPYKVPHFPFVLKSHCFSLLSCKGKDDKNRCKAWQKKHCTERKTESCDFDLQ